MMNTLKYRWLGIIVLVLCSIFFFTGCSAAPKVKTEITIHEDLSGVRTIKANIDPNVLSQYYTGTLQDINTLIEENCPEELNWSWTEQGGIYAYTFTLEFANIEEYNQKVHHIITNEEWTEDVEPWIDFELIDSCWAKRVSYEEDFTSGDLLRWLKKALIEEGIVTERESHYLFSNEETLWNFENQTHSTYEYAYVEYSEFTEYRRIEISTTVNEDGTYDREVLFVADYAVVEAKEEEIKAYMNSLVPEGATSEWYINSQGEQVFAVKKTGMDLQTLNAFMNYYFGEGTCELTVVQIGALAAPFRLARDYKEVISFRRFYDKEMQFVPTVHYSIQSKDGYVIVGGNNEKAETDVRIGETKSFSVGYHKLFHPVHADLETKILGNNNFERTLKIQFDKVPTDADLKEIEKNIIEMFVTDGVRAISYVGKEPDAGVEYEVDYNISQVLENYKKELKIDIYATVSEEGFFYTIVQRGTEEEIMNSSMMLYGETDCIMYTEESSVFSLKKEVAFYEVIQLRRFLSQRTAECELQHTVSFMAGTKLLYSNVETYTIDGKQISGIHMDNSVSLSIVGARWNLWAIAFWSALFLTLVGSVLVLFKHGAVGYVVRKVRTTIEESREVRKEEDSSELNGLPTVSYVQKPQEPAEINTSEAIPTEEAWVVEIAEEQLEDLNVEIDI